MAAYRVWTDSQSVSFRSFERAERFARRYVASTAQDEFARVAYIDEGIHPVAIIRLDGLGRVWTDLIDPELPV